ncbi:MAG: cytochrome c biogenesis protein ResB [bacterium]|nr:cytochrome c biogenesis protein ResB [bacterium]
MNTNQSTNEKKGNANPVLRILKAGASLKLTVICLVLLVVIVVWGTVYQADHGLYQAQQKFFHSWVFLVFGVIPFPGTVLVMFVFFFNLVCVLFFRIGFRWSNAGNIITHLGIVVLLVGGFFTFYFSEESSLVMKEGETAHMSTSRQLWEVAVYERKTGDKDVYALDSDGLDPGDTIRLDDLNLLLNVNDYYPNCSAFTGRAAENAENKPVNASGVAVLKEKPAALEASDNVAGIILDVASPASPGSRQTLLLYGRDNLPTPLKVENRTFVFSLRKKKIPLPLSMSLLDFKVKFYPNSTIPKSYESRVTINAEGTVEREVVISMNKPMRFADLTFFQASYYTAPDGTEYTVLSVVKNFGRLLPYFSSIIIFLGLLIHFIMMLMRRRKQKPANNG